MLVMVLTALVPTAVLFPVVMIGATVITFVVSVAFFREKFTVKQLCGYLIGVVSLVLINI
jgi:multidrug transporter EmrE-like cation transporter